MLWIIEPHADDAFLSLHEHITQRWDGVPKTIVTVYCDNTRAQEAATYADAVGCRHIALRFDRGTGLGGIAGEIPNIDEWGLKIMPGDRLYLPVGLQHPEHLATVAAVASVDDPCPIFRYLDTPYYAKLKIGPEMASKTRGMMVRSMIYASARKWKHIATFKSQGRYFFHHPPESLPRLELVLQSVNEKTRQT